VSFHELTLDRLRSHPREADWWAHFFLDGGSLVGSGGYVGRPREGVVEIGDEIAPGVDASVVKQL
jgi:[ribosomal protein S5]-alanine N-acetyltransferase